MSRKDVMQLDAMQLDAMQLEAMLLDAMQLEAYCSASYRSAMVFACDGVAVIAQSGSETVTGQVTTQ